MALVTARPVGLEKFVRIAVLSDFMVKTVAARVNATMALFAITLMARANVAPVTLARIVWTFV